MNQSMVTIVAPLDPARVAQAQAAIDTLGNPARPEIATKLRELDGLKGIHFVSLHALPSFTAGKAHLVLEMSSDGDEGWAVGWLASTIGGELDTVFGMARDRGSASIASYLASHTIRTGFGIGANPGIGHAGAPGWSVGRIRRERDLHRRIADVLAEQDGNMSALARLDAVRAALKDDLDALGPAEPLPPSTIGSVASVIAPALGAFAKTYLGPVLALFVVVWAIGMALQCMEAAQLRDWAATIPAGQIPPGDRWWMAPDASWIAEAAHLLLKTIGWAVRLAGIFLLALLVAAGILYARLRRQEDSDWTSDRDPEPAVLAEIFARENIPGYAHNHMVSLTERKPGWLRYFTQRLMFFAIATVGPRLYKRGYLGSIGTIHFARWITIPGTRDLVFFSNYGGSWESYLEDFITLSHVGLTGVWSNTVGFPKTTNLAFGGASDGERFKRYARQSMLPTYFWYSAYPDLDTDMIRANADIRRGLSGAMTEDGAALWLSRFGSALRPELKLVTSEIQSLVFGGLGFFPFATATFWRLPGDVVKARAWLREVAPEIAWSDGRRLRDKGSANAIVQLGLGASGMAALGMPREGVESFPAAFRDGMEARARILGDTGEDAREQWWWGGPIDAALLVFAENPKARDWLLSRLNDFAARHGATLVHKVPLADLRQEEPPVESEGAVTAEKVHEELKALAAKVDAIDSGNAQHSPPRFDPEPFGFADGISQPLILGTYKAERDEANSLHIVAPGEFVLGYPDGRGNTPPGPRLDALHDPANVLPLHAVDPVANHNDVNQPRDLGRNGTFLVIRQLEQHVAAFDAYCEAEAARLKGRLTAPYWVTPEWIGAKMIGRWKNGAPLVRSPYIASNKRAIIDENAFLPGFEDPEGLHCPFGSHIRRSNPRDSLHPGSTDQVAISNRHRILRVGRKYEPEGNQQKGILFMCLNGDLERQFEFVQQTWMRGNVISLSCPTNLAGERDPVIGSESDNSGFTIPTRDGPVKLKPLPRFVQMRGGGYFFMPGRRLVTWLSQE
jgi:deferrochelatase/peroxidase EfeB